MLDPVCQGTGYLWSFPGGLTPNTIPCWRCAGTGMINDVTNKGEHVGTDATLIDNGINLNKNEEPFKNESIEGSEFNTGDNENE